MKKKNLKEITETLLCQKANEEEKQMLRELGFKINSPTKQAVMVAALYKKASSGDLSAIKELRAIIGDTSDSNCLGVVTIVDDTKS